MKVQVESRKLIKPCSPTPENRKSHKISFIDELMPSMNVTVILYYAAPSKEKLVVKELEQSLGEVLALFYPFAGRYMKKDHLVDCSDQGALFLEANVDLQLSQVVDDNNVTPRELNDLLPCEIGEADKETDPILSVKINKFTCGGVAIGISIIHKLVDAYSLGIFVSAWANATRGEANICPIFDGPVFFPGKNLPTPEMEINRENGVACKIFRFDKATISRLKERAGSGRPRSSVEVVSGLIFCAVAGVDKARDGLYRDLIALQGVNTRERTAQAPSKYSCGGFGAPVITLCSAEETKSMGFQDWVRVLADDARKTVGDCAKLLSEDGQRLWIDAALYESEKSEDEDVNCVVVSDWTEFGYYEADFGWGKPVWASIVDVFFKNLITLMSTKDGDGIEAWVQLQGTAMPYFEQQINNIISDN